MNKLPFIPFLLVVFITCTGGDKSAPMIKDTPPGISIPDTIPDLKDVNPQFCANESNINGVAAFVKLHVGDKSWEEIQSGLVKSGTPEDSAKSISLQKARAVIATCAKELFGAVATGSGRDLSEMNTKNALKDIDMSVPFLNAEASNTWLRKLLPDPDRMMLFSLLSEPISSLPCKSLKGKSMTTCAINNTVETSQILVLNEITNAKSHTPDSHYASVKDISKICPTGFILPPEYSEVYSIITLTPAEEKEYIGKFPDSPKKTSSYKSSIRYKIILTALKNPAYYIQAESIRKWVVEREKDFQDELSSKYAIYSSGKGVREIETEGAVLEQWIHAHRHADSFYYKFKYLFRALEHIGFIVEKETPELASVHKLLKKTRPSSLKDAYTDLVKLNTPDAQKESPKLIELNNITYEKFEELIKKSETKQLNAILEYYKIRRKEKNSTWNQVCKE